MLHSIQISESAKVAPVDKILRLMDDREGESVESVIEDGEAIYAMVAAVAEAEGLDPTTMEEVQQHNNWPKWENAINAKLKSLKDAHTWDVVECPDDTNLVGCKWVHKIKCNAAGEIDKYKARLVTKGYSQVPSIDYNEIYTPITCLTSLCTLLTIAAHNDWDVNVFNFHSAFLNGKLDNNEHIYIELPPGFEAPKHLKNAVTKL